MTQARSRTLAMSGCGLALYLGLALPGIAAAQSPAPSGNTSGTIRAIEQVLETRSSAVALPSSGVGTVTVTPCEGCRPVTMLAGNESTWLLGARPVAFSELRRALQANPRAPVLVFYRGPGAELIRLVAQVRGTPPP